MVEIYRKQFPEGQFVVFNDPPSFRPHLVKQIHSNKIVPARGDLVEADGLIGEQETLAIITADCLPILLLGQKRFGLVHAGWRGLKDGILKNTDLKKLEINRAFIGPHINNCCYEVTSEFLDNFPNIFFIKREDKYFFSLRDVAILHLKKTFGDIEIDVASECTHCNSHFHSYRRDQTAKRNWNIWIPNIVDTLHTTG